MANAIYQDPEDTLMEDGFASEVLLKASKKTFVPVVVDDEHPFDLETYISSYTGVFSHLLYDHRFLTS